MTHKLALPSSSVESQKLFRVRALSLSVLFVGALVLCGVLASQTPAKKSAPIRPDGIKVTHEEHRVDLSECDEVTIQLPVRDLSVSSGEVTIYAWKKFGMDGLKITCVVDRGAK